MKKYKLPKLSRTERAKVLDAAQRILEGKFEFSCHALSGANNVDRMAFPFEPSPLAKKFCSFYDEPMFGPWLKGLHPSEKRKMRVLLLVNFAEVCK